MKIITFPCHGYMVHQEFCKGVMAVKTNQRDIDERPSGEG